tara:strand:- start:282 stop:3023 length:2742 start_codon:yes stop_codon:yes gene_type:complete
MSNDEGAPCLLASTSTPTSTHADVEEAWIPFFVWKSLRAVREAMSESAHAGTVVSLLDAYHTRVVVELDDDAPSREAHVPMCDRFDGMHEVVSQCQDTCRIRVTTFGVHVLVYEFLVHPAALSSALDSGNMLVYEILLRVCRNMPPHARIVRPSAVQEVTDSPHTGNLSTWRDTQLLTSQEESLRWMQSVESRVESGGFLVCHGEGAARLPNTRWYYDFARFDLRRGEVMPSQALRLKGAVLGDDMGAGKTATVLRLICEDLSLSRVEDASSITAPDNPQCATDAFDASSLLTHSGQERVTPLAKGTLVLLPPNLQFQWASEVAKFTQNLNVVSMTERSKHTVQDLLQADVVLCTWQHLRAPAYISSAIELFRRLAIRVANVRDALRDAGMTAGIARAVEARSAWRDVPALVELVTWKRIVLDEVHEYFIDGNVARERCRTVGCLRGNVWWGVSGTPVGEAEQVRKMVAFFTVGGGSAGDHHHAHPVPTLRLFEDQALRRNAFRWTGVQHVVRNVKLSSHERLVLQCCADASLEERLSISSGTGMDGVDVPSVESHSQMVLSDMQKRVHQFQERVYYIEGAREKGVRALANDEQRLDLLENPVDLATNRDASQESTRGDAIRGSIRQHKKNITACIRSVRALEEQLAVAQARHHLLASRVAQLEMQNQTCPLCANSTCDVITDCGHAFCTGCLVSKRATDDAAVAPRASLGPGHRADREVVTSDVKACPTCPTCQHTFRASFEVEASRFGGCAPPAKWSCLFDLIDTLVTQAKERVVVFVPTRKTHRALRRALECPVKVGGQLPVTVRVLEGSSGRRSTELQRFNESSAGAVLMLCLEDSSAGLNLTCSRHVVLFAPLACDVQTAQNVESQAIARVARMGQTREVTVHHLITSASCEEDLWRSQHQSLQYWRQ